MSTTSEILVLRSFDLEQDAERLAAMWQASNDQWPGTVSEGVPITVEWVRNWAGRQKAIDELVWEVGDAIAGYCSLWPWMDEPNVHYIATLNVAPGYQKQSLGRKFLTHYVRRALELGSVRLDLHTWPGNLKAVPLYKKCGFFWLPGTGVHMLNFMPAILQLPCAQGFFERHDWYSSLRRELTQAEDDERWEGLKVFTYHFEAGDERLTVWADRLGRTITAVETDDFFAAALPADVEPPRGLSTTMRWRLTNKRDRPVDVQLVANGSAELKLEQRATFTLAAGETRELTAPVQVAAQMPEVEHDKPAPLLRSLLVIDGQILELGSGLSPRAAVELRTYPEYITLAPGVPQTVELQLRSRLQQPIEASVGLAPQPGLVADWSQQRLALAADATAALALTLRAEAGGVYELPVALGFELAGAPVQLPFKQLAIFALPAGGVLGARVEQTLRVENETLRLVLKEQGSEAALYQRATGEWLADYNGYPVPPFRPSEYWDALFDLQIERASDHVVAVASVASKEFPGFVLRKRFRVNAGPLLEISYDFENLGADARSFQLQQWLGGDDDRATLTLPLAAGLVQGHWSDFPGFLDDEWRRPSTFAERWSARAYRNATVGLIWSEEIEEIDWALLSRAYDCPPHSRVRPAPLYVYLGEGDWRAVRRLWQRLAGQPEATAVQPLVEPQAPLAARFDPSPVLLVGESVETTLLVEHLRSRKLDATARLTLPAGWQSSADTFELRELAWRTPGRVSLRLSSTARPGPALAQLALRAEEVDADWQLPLMRLGDGSAVEVRASERARQPTFVVSNGRLELEATPGFGGTVSSLRDGGVELLRSPFPNVATFGWMSPWYGGFMPVVLFSDEKQFPGRLGREHFEAAALDAPDARGIAWRGVRQRTVLTGEHGTGLAVEIDTLTLGSSPVVKLVLRIINPTTASRMVSEAGWMLFVQPGGSGERTTLWNADGQIKQTDRMVWTASGNWAAAENPTNGRTLALVAPLPDAMLAGWGKDGGHLRMLSRLVAPAGGAVELTAYLCLADDLEQARAYMALKELR